LERNGTGKGKRFLSALLAVMLVLSIFTAMAGAREERHGMKIKDSEEERLDDESVSENDSAEDDSAEDFNDSPPAILRKRAEIRKEELREKIKEKREHIKNVKNIRERELRILKRTREDFNRVKQEYSDARARYQEARASRDPALQMDAARDFLLMAVDTMISYLEMVKGKLESQDSQRVIDNYIAELQEKRDEVASAQNMAELRSVARDIRKIWMEVKSKAKHRLAYRMDNRLKELLEKSDKISQRIDEAISRLKDQGVDTTSLEEMLADFNAKIGEARDNRDRAHQLYQEGQDIREVEKYLRAATLDLKEAYKILKKIFLEIRKHGKPVILHGTGTLYAEGNGTALLAGNLTINIETNATGVLLVSQNAQVTATGEGNRTELPNGYTKYQGFGEAQIQGDEIKVKVTGREIKLKAEGTGRAVLKGNGTYHTEKGFPVSNSAAWINTTEGTT